MLRSFLVIPLLVAACGGSIAPDASADGGTSPANADAGVPPCPSPRFRVVATIDGGTDGNDLESLTVAGGNLYYRLSAIDHFGPNIGLWTVPTAGGTPVRLSSEDVDAFWIQPDGSILETLQGQLFSLPASGGARTTIGGLNPNAGSGPVGIAFQADDTYVYVWALDDSKSDFEIWKAARTGGPAQELFATTDPNLSPDQYRTFGMDADALYFSKAARPQARVVRVPKAGGAASSQVFTETIFPGGVLAALAGVAYAGVYPAGVTDHTTLAGLPAAGGDPTAVPAILDPYRLAVDGDTIFAASISTYGAPAGSISSGAVWAYDTVHGVATLVGCGPEQPGFRPVAVTVDSSAVYAAFNPPGDIFHYTLMAVPRR
jgi:hypothetical protein